VTRAQIVIPSTLAGLLAVLGVQHIAGGRPVAVIVPSAATTGAASTKAAGTAGSRASQQTAEAARTAVGRDVTTQYGDVQFKVTVKGGKIQKVAPSWR
jgi:hypothetical protein